jgi:hypothetical protein
MAEHDERTAGDGGAEEGTQYEDPPVPVEQPYAQDAADGHE